MSAAPFGSHNHFCPFTNPGPLEAHYAAADAFHRDLQQEFISDDTADATLATKHTLLSLHEEDRARLRGRPTRTLVVRNPFLHADARRSVFDECLAQYLDVDPARFATDITPHRGRSPAAQVDRRFLQQRM
ncbi:hypothetical protein B0H14DRAFT_3876370 [Mycena olivaceomarginata]|nr:hypothetical protein B0H14DRAFT_3876370 [Mycena olivaceomarginata]